MNYKRQGELLCSVAVPLFVRVQLSQGIKLRVWSSLSHDEVLTTHVNLSSNTSMASQRHHRTRGQPRKSIKSNLKTKFTGQISNTNINMLNSRESLSEPWSFFLPLNLSQCFITWWEKGVERQMHCPCLMKQVRVRRAKR